MNNKQVLITTDEAPTIKAAKVLKGGNTFVRVDGITVDGAPFFLGGSRADRAQGLVVSCYGRIGRRVYVEARGDLHAAQVEAARNNVTREVKSSRYGSYTAVAAIWSLAIPIEEERV